MLELVIPDNLSHTQVVSLRAATFCLLYAAFNKFLEYKVLLCPPKRTSGNNEARWRTSVVSFCHSVITVVACCIGLISLWSDFIENQSFLCEIIMSIITGYAIYDFFNLLRYNELSRVWSRLIHHCIIAAVTTSMALRQNLFGYGVWCAIVEGNAMFFHSRGFILAHDWPKSSHWFKLNRQLYKITFLLIRAPILASTLMFLYLDRDRMPAIYYYFFSTSVIGLTILNTTTYYNLVLKVK